MLRRIGIGSIIAMLFGAAVLAQSGIDAEGVATGKTVLWFRATEVTARIDSEFDVHGSLIIDGRTVPFTASGTASGEGIGDSAAMTFDVWLIMDAVGTTEDGDPITIRGGMAGSSEDVDLLGGALGSAIGPFLLVVTLGPDSYRAQGTAEGRAAGAFVVPEDPLTMQLEGTASYKLIGDLAPDVLPSEAEGGQSAYVHLMPWDADSWPPELFGTLLALLDEAPSVRVDEPEGESTDG